MNRKSLNVILCNKAKLPNSVKAIKDKKIIKLNYDKNDKETKVYIGLPKFVDNVNHLPDNIKDLLEIACYVYLADRKISRGSNNQVEFQAWSRDMHFVIKIRDFKFWNNRKTKKALSDALKFLSGDRNYDFTFEQGRDTGRYNLFDEQKFQIQKKQKTRIILFSGGLDSLSGLLETLETTKDDVCLISHKSSSSGMSVIRKGIQKMLDIDYPGRCKPFEFHCYLKGERAVDESQRTRSFLYSSIAFALASAHSINELYYYENGVTSINFSDSEDLINARASRTTHPKSIWLMNNFLENFNDDFRIRHPFLFKTKSDIVKIIEFLGKQKYIRNSVTCSKTFKTEGEHTHCGGCSQCIDRKFAIYFNKMSEFDDDLGLYNINFIVEKVEDGSVRKTLMDYVRLAMYFQNCTLQKFANDKLEMLAEIVDYIDGINDDEKTQRLYELCHNHGKQVEKAIENMQNKYCKPFKQNKFENKSFLSMIKLEDHFKKPIEEVVMLIVEKLKGSIPILFRKNKPLDENDFNDKIEGLISSLSIEYQREFPTITFALAKTIPDHASLKNNLLIESKYLRGKKALSVITNELGADLVKYGASMVGLHVLFLIYDPERIIYDDLRFKKDFESYNCTIELIR